MYISIWRVRNLHVIVTLKRHWTDSAARNNWVSESLKDFIEPLLPLLPSLKWWAHAAQNQPITSSQNLTPTPWPSNQIKLCFWLGAFRQISWQPPNCAATKLHLTWWVNYNIIITPSAPLISLRPFKKRTCLLLTVAISIYLFSNSFWSKTLQM